jgi:hypothetical protein
VVKDGRQDSSISAYPAAPHAVARRALSVSPQRSTSTCPAASASFVLDALIATFDHAGCAIPGASRAVPSTFVTMGID